MRRGIMKVLFVFAFIWAIPLTLTFARNETSFILTLPINQGWTYQELATTDDESIQFTPVTLTYKSSDSSNQEVQICIDRKGTSLFAFWDRSTEIHSYKVGETFNLTASRKKYIKNYKLRICARNGDVETLMPVAKGTIITF